MSDALWAAQAAVQSRLAADVGVRAQIGDPVRLYDHVPPGAAFPYVTFGETNANDYGTKDGAGLEQTVTLHVFSRYRGRKQVKDILAALYDALHQQNLTVSGQSFVDCRFSSAATVRTEDGVTYQGVIRFRVRTLEI